MGEGEPTFEVKCGDELVLKVVCEKVDIKSPEKGGGPSMVKASGKVRFAGFGAEGICEELSLLAGTGEVTMAGAVNIKVKDKLGRVERPLRQQRLEAPRRGQRLLDLERQLRCHPACGGIDDQSLLHPESLGAPSTMKHCVPS